MDRRRSCRHAEGGEDPCLRPSRDVQHAGGLRVLRRLREARPHEALRGREGLRRRPARHHHDRPEPAEGGRGGRQRAPALGRRPLGSGGHHRRPDRAGAGDGGRRQLQPLEGEPGHGRWRLGQAGRLGVQALHALRRHGRRVRPAEVLVGPVHDHDPGQGVLHGREAVDPVERLGRRERHVQPEGRHRLLGEHGVRPGDRGAGADPRGGHGARPGDPVEARSVLLRNPWHRGGEPPGDDERLRDARRSRPSHVGDAADLGERSSPAGRPPDQRRCAEPARAAGPTAERRRSRHVRIAGGGGLRHRYRRRHRTAGRRQDRHRAGIRGRLVLRLPPGAGRGGCGSRRLPGRPAARDVRVDGLPGWRETHGQRGGRRAGLRRHDPRRDLARLHGAGGRLVADRRHRLPGAQQRGPRQGPPHAGAEPAALADGHP